jgi:hypothetical protein
MISVPRPSSDFTEKLPPTDLTLDAIPTIPRAATPRLLGDRSDRIPRPSSRIESCSVRACEQRVTVSLEKDAPVSRAVDRAGHILCRPILGGLHHQYARI